MLAQKVNGAAGVVDAEAARRVAAGFLSGFVGVVIFSGSLVATRLGVVDLGPLFLTAARAVIAALCGGLLLLATRQPLPQRGDIGPLAVVALGVVVGFPLLTGYALTEISAARATIFNGLLPLATAIAAAVMAGERPTTLFWACAVTGSAVVAGYAATGAGASAGKLGADAAMFGAIVVCGVGYAEGARLSRRLGGWQVISWALVLSLPVMLPLALATVPDLAAVGTPAWLGLGYVSLFSMLIGFVFWYRGLALGGIAAVGQVQLLQPFLGLAAAAVVLGEHIDAGLIVAAAAVLACVAVSRRFAGRPAR